MKRKLYTTWSIVLFLIILPVRAQKNLEAVFRDNEYQLTGVAISENQRLFTCYPYWNESHRYGVVEILPDGKAVPYPDEAWNNWKDGEDGKDKFVCPQAVWVDEKNHLWVVDPANPFFKGTVSGAVKIIAFDLENNTLYKTIFLPADIAGPGSYINDIRVDNKRQIAYLTNSNEGSIIVVDIVTGGAWKFLDRHYSTKSDSTYQFKPGGKIWADEQGRKQVHADGIALDLNGKYLYYKALTDDKLYRIKTKNLRNYYIKENKMHRKVEDLGHVASSDGMVFDRNGFLYLGDIEKNAIIRFNPGNKRTEVVLQDTSLIWPDSYAVSQDGYLYIACSQIHQMPAFNHGKNQRTSPFSIYRIKIN